MSADPVTGERLKLALPNVTLVMIAGSFVAPARMAVVDAVKGIDFGDVLLFANDDMGLHWPTKKTAIRSSDDAWRLGWYDVERHVKTTHALFVQWDGYPIRPGLWDDQFLAYDYVGAIWPYMNDGMTVGSSGCCLRSRRLMRALAYDKDFAYAPPDDVHIGRTLRPALESAYGIQFAPEDVAQRFCHEHGPIGAKAFAFHGVWNMMDHMTDRQIMERLSLLMPDQWSPQHMNFMSHRALLADRRDLCLWLKQRGA